MFLFLSLLGVAGTTIVVYSLSPYFGALGLVLLSLSLCCLLAYLGFSFLGLVMLLIYLGGMMVVFIYSSALASDKHPKIGGWGGAFLTFMFLMGVVFMNSGEVFIWKKSLSKSPVITSKSSGWMVNSFLENLDWSGCGLLFNSLFGLLLIVALALIVALVLVLVLSFGSYKKSLRALK